MLEKSDSYSMQRTSWKKEMLSIWYQGKDLKKKKCNFSAEATAAERRSAQDGSSKGWRERDLGQEKGSCWVSEKAHLWLLSTMWLKGKAALRPLKLSSQRPQRTQAGFRHRAGKKIIPFRVGYLQWIIAEPKCWVCLPFRHLRGSAGQGENSLVLCF